MIPIHTPQLQRLDQLVSRLQPVGTSISVLQQLSVLLRRHTNTRLSSFVTEWHESLLVVERWLWTLLSDEQPERAWLHDDACMELFESVAALNKQLICQCDDVEVEAKAPLLLAVSGDEIERILVTVKNLVDEDDPYIRIAARWLDNVGYFFFEHPTYHMPAVVDRLDQSIVRDFVITKQYKFYLAQLRQPHLTPSILTAKLSFYVKTCSLQFYTCLFRRLSNIPYTADELMIYLYEDFSEIVRIHSRTVASWSDRLTGCIAQVIGLLGACCWWDGHQRTQIKIMFPTEQSTFDYIEDLTQILANERFYNELQSIRFDDVTSLMESILMVLLLLVQTQNIDAFFRSNTVVRDRIMFVAELAPNAEVRLCGYCIIGRTLADDQLKDLKIADNITDYVLNMVQIAWNSPVKMFKHIPVEYMLPELQILSKNDTIQQTIACSHKIGLFIDMCKVYPIVFSIIWAISFNNDIQQQLRSETAFVEKLTHLAANDDDEHIRKVTNGILWNLGPEYQRRSTQVDEDDSFDIMMSYSHKDKLLCKQLYDELTRRGYRVWIDFDQMHGNVMDAMAHAIDRSRTIILCMSEQYRKSNFCRAEAHYAFQRQRHIVPVLVQKQYRADGWLLFLVGQLLYVDFTKHEFGRATEMLVKELKNTNDAKATVSIEPETLRHPTPVRDMRHWDKSEVQQWLIECQLTQMARLLGDCDGRSLAYLGEYIKLAEPQHVFSSMQEDARRLINENLSLIELARFQSLMDRQRDASSTNDSHPGGHH